MRIFIFSHGRTFGGRITDLMRCAFCKTRTILRKICPTCAKVVAIVDRAAGQVGMGELVDLFLAEGLTREQVDLVLDAEIGDQPTIRDRLTSQMANALMQGLGMPGRQSPQDVRRVRLAASSGSGEGTWRGGDKPPDAQ
ncbi:MAG TPA: hypothetical protein VKB84_15605 [Candidatus Binataceae bacterium]|nr:hypothetical protein [Candidatus Binataceae bacterium]